MLCSGSSCNVRNKNGKKKNIVWNFFKKIIDKENKASFKCKYCDQMYRNIEKLDVKNDVKNDIKNDVKNYVKNDVKTTSKIT